MRKEAMKLADNDSDAVQVSFCRPGLVCCFMSDPERVGSGKNRPLNPHPITKQGQASSEAQTIYVAKLYKLEVWTPRLEVSDFGAAINKCVKFTATI